MYSLHPLRLAVISSSDESSTAITGLLSSLDVPTRVERFSSLQDLAKSLRDMNYDAAFVFDQSVSYETHATELDRILSKVQTFIVHAGEASQDLLWRLVQEEVEHLFLHSLTPTELLRAIWQGIRLKRKERELAESNSALERSEKQYRTLVENSIDGIEMLDSKGRVLFVNDAVVRKVLGVGAKRIVGRSAFDFVHPDDLAKVRSAFSDVLTHPGKIVTLEYRVCHLNGASRWVEAVGANRIDDPDFGAIVVNHRDITEKRSTLHQLQQRNEQLEALLSSSPIAIVTLTDGGRVKRWNHAAEAMFGWKEHEVVNQYPPVIDKCDLEKFQATQTDLVAGNRLKEKRAVLRHRNGSQVIAEISAAPILDSAGHVSKIMAIVADVTERERTVQALRESEEKYRLLVERSLGGVFLATGDGKITDCNDSFALSLGFERATEVIGQNFLDFLTSDESKARLRQRLCAGDSIVAEELNFNRTDGGPVFLMSDLTIAERDGGSNVLVQGCTIDVTEHRELKRQMANVQRMEGIGRLVGGISHDFNNMIMIMTSYSELVLDSLKSDDPAREYIQQILSAADRGSSLVRQLLAFIRRQVLEPINLDLNEIVSDMAKMLPRLLGEDIAIDLHASEKPAIINVDCSQLEQILLNLSVNARDAMPKGGRLTIETAHVELDLHYSRTHMNMRPGRYVMLAVSDTGHGIDRALQAHILEPFFTTKARGKGTGLGLSTVYGIVKQSDGYIWVYSEPGQGTTFKIYFPEIDAPVEQEVQRKQPEHYSGTETILFVEDEANLRRPACAFLEGQGYRVLEAATGSEAIAIAESEPQIDALVTDVVMPGLNGPETAAAVLRRHPNASVLYVSGYTDNVLSSHGVHPSGAFLQKPCGLSSLARKVREVLDPVASEKRANTPQ